MQQAVGKQWGTRLPAWQGWILSRLQVVTKFGRAKDDVLRANVLRMHAPSGRDWSMSDRPCACVTRPSRPPGPGSLCRAAGAAIAASGSNAKHRAASQDGALKAASSGGQLCARRI
eukprot:356694-Chlamydomonas_euryale.AAC.4